MSGTKFQPGRLTKVSPRPAWRQVGQQGCRRNCGTVWQKAMVVSGIPIQYGIVHAECNSMKINKVDNNRLVRGWKLSSYLGLGSKWGIPQQCRRKGIHGSVSSWGYSPTFAVVISQIWLWIGLAYVIPFISSLLWVVGYRLTWFGLQCINVPNLT